MRKKKLRAAGILRWVDAAGKLAGANRKQREVELMPRTILAITILATMFAGCAGGTMTIGDSPPIRLGGPPDLQDARDCYSACANRLQLTAQAPAALDRECSSRCFPELSPRDGKAR